MYIIDIVKAFIYVSLLLFEFSYNIQYKILLSILCHKITIFYVFLNNLISDKLVLIQLMTLC